MEATAADMPDNGTTERRRHPREERVLLAVCFGGRTYTTANWSMGGFYLSDYEGDLATGALVTVVGMGRDGDHLKTVNLPARVVRSGPHAVAVNYLGLDSEAYAFLEQIMSESGQMRSLLDPKTS